jgi:ubiquinol-cytochrome c reductase cytochrome c1 subunit
METRKKTGLIVLAFLLALAGVLYLAYKQVWRGESH